MWINIKGINNTEMAFNCQKITLSEFYGNWELRFWSNNKNPEYIMHFDNEADAKLKHAIILSEVSVTIIHVNEKLSI